MADFSKVKLLIIDLDNTLCDTFHTLSKRQWGKAEEALVKLGHAEHAGVFRKNLGHHSFKSVIERLKLPPHEREAAIHAYDSVGVERLRLYNDAHAILDFDIPKVLVTRGEKRLQVKKIRHLGLAKRFKKVYCVPTLEDKSVAFRQILKDFGFKPGECLVIGDRVEEEILDANRLGMRSALIDRPDWPTRRGVAKPDMTVKSLTKIAQKLHV